MKKAFTLLTILLINSIVYGQAGLLSVDNKILISQGKVLYYEPYPSLNLQAIFDINKTEINGDLINLSGDANAIYISGSGADAVYDFSGLNDNRFDKSNATYWTQPLDIYFHNDASNPYYSKLKDFHHKYLWQQMASEKDFAFGKGIFDDFGYGLYCLENGLIYGTSTNAYGVVFEARINKVRTTSVYFISDDITGVNNGYGFALSTDERIYLWKYTGGSSSRLFRTAPAYIDINEDYWYKLVRNSVLDEFVTGAIGTFAMYIKGGAFGNSYVLVDVTGGSETNPVTDNTHTTSSNIVLDMDFDDEIRDIYITDILLNTYSFTTSSGSFEIDNLKEFDELLIYSASQVGSDLDQLLNYSNYILSENKYINEDVAPLISFMGNSLTSAHTYPNKVLYLQNNKYYLNKGIGGDRTDGMLARFQTDIIDKKPIYVCILGGINDVSIGRTAADTKADLQSMYTAAKDAGIIVVGLTVTPWDDATTEQQTKIDDINDWILNTAVDMDYTLDSYTLLEDPGNPGHLLPAYSDDGIHLTVLGYQTLGIFVYNNVIWLALNFNNEKTEYLTIYKNVA